MEALSTQTDPWREEVDRVARMIRLLLKLKQKKQKGLAPILHVDESSVSRKISSGVFDIRELYAVAAFLEEPVTTLFKDPDSLITTWLSPMSLVRDPDHHRPTQEELPFAPVFSVVP